MTTATDCQVPPTNKCGTLPPTPMAPPCCALQTPTAAAARSPCCWAPPPTWISSTPSLAWCVVAGRLCCAALGCAGPGWPVHCQTSKAQRMVCKWVCSTPAACASRPARLALQVTQGFETLAKLEELPTRKEGIFVMPLDRISILSTYM